MPGEHKVFKLKLFAVRSGLIPVSGLIIKDSVKEKEVVFKKSFG